MGEYVEHISGGKVKILMSDAEKARCETSCSDFGDPPCYLLPRMTSSWPKGEPVRVCFDCKDA